MEAFNEFTVSMEDRIRAFCNESEVEKGKTEVRRLTEELRVAKEETRKKMGEAMLLKDEWQRARRERVAFETKVDGEGLRSYCQLGRCSGLVGGGSRSSSSF
ncbi:hypothetical protein Bca4012_051233 [Brassica carinata]|uniref:Uncharacterized protein n=1 Tax=Brassica carinata TaxID=52824 RepID=A0A8X7R9Q9_BRACI|nr:hypothetical protein Bca52824_053868 [Brassica carinata]